MVAYLLLIWYSRVTLGTGKTEVARIIAEIFADNEILEGNFVEVQRNDLVAGYVRTNSN